MENFELVPAVWEELNDYMEILNQGRRFQRWQGFVQWPDGYPDRATVETDLSSGKGYAFRVAGQLAGYLYIGFDGDPAYSQIQGNWHGEGSYAVIHRIAIAPDFRGRGLADAVFRLVATFVKQKGVNHLCIDTDAQNFRMRHVLEKNGFSYCGTVIQGGGERLAFDKELK